MYTVSSVEQSICMHKPINACRSAWLDQGKSHLVCFSVTKVAQILAGRFQLGFGTESKLLVFPKTVEVSELKKV